MIRGSFLSANKGGTVRFMETPWIDMRRSLQTSVERGGMQASLGLVVYHPLLRLPRFAATSAGTLNKIQPKNQIRRVSHKSRLASLLMGARKRVTACGGD
eukprot:gb/GFBE01057687.1/.p1 GENE.gb/GFBE01057687.1/~~gb/GFBE01057687.1/.p1  ORF type:complete len:100 (+),score=7.31 gb/GFBE01057687.1/:1-300(+)